MRRLSASGEYRERMRSRSRANWVEKAALEPKRRRMAKMVPPTRRSMAGMPAPGGARTGAVEDVGVGEGMVAMMKARSFTCILQAICHVDRSGRDNPPPCDHSVVPHMQENIECSMGDDSNPNAFVNDECETEQHTGHKHLRRRQRTLIDVI